LTNELTQWENSPLRQSSQSYRTVVTHSIFIKYIYIKT